MKAFTDNKIRLNEKSKLVLQRIESIKGMGENAANQHFLLFPQRFPKLYFSGSLNAKLCGKGFSHN